MGRRKEAAPHIEEGIRPLVDAMNSKNWLCTYASCEGHMESSWEHDHRPYVAFLCKGTEARKVCDAIFGAERKIRRARLFFDLWCDVHYSRSRECERPEHRDWIPLALFLIPRQQLEGKPRRFRNHRDKAVAILAETFRELD